MVQRNSTQEQRFFLSPNSQLYPAVVFNGDSRHGSDSCLVSCTHSNSTLNRDLVNGKNKTGRKSKKFDILGTRRSQRCCAEWFSSDEIRGLRSTEVGYTGTAPEPTVPQIWGK